MNADKKREFLLSFAHDFLFFLIRVYLRSSAVKISS